MLDQIHLASKQIQIGDSSENDVFCDERIATIRELIDWRAQASPENVFLVSPHTEKWITNLGLQQSVRSLSRELIRAGLKCGDKIAFLLDNGLYTAQLFLGVMYGGFVAVPLNVRAGVSQLSHTLDHSDANVVYVSEDYRSLIEEVMGNVHRVVRVIYEELDSLVGEDHVSESFNMRSVPPSPEDPALLMYTSGSTGQPKAAIHSHRTILAHARNSINAHQLSSSDRSLLVLPLYHINAECVTLIPTLMSGGSVVVPHRFSVSEFWDWLDNYECTWSAVVPTIISQLLDWQDPGAGARGPAFRRIRFLRSSSAPLAPSLHREFLERFDLLLIQAMGSSEAGNVFSNPLPPAENKIGSPGLPWGFEAKIVNREGVEVPAGESGEVLLRGAAIMQGYYKQPEESVAVLDTDGWLHTGDLAYRDKDGYFFVVGRSKELIIKGGVNIAPRQIDDVLESHPSVLEAACVGVPDHYLGEDVVAFVVLRSGGVCSESQLLRFCEPLLGHFKTPTRIYFTSELPKGPSGKVQRLRLRDEVPHAALAASLYRTLKVDKGITSDCTETALEEIEQLVADTWAEVLSQSSINSESNFFVLGGHSLLAVQCVASLREKIPVALSLSDFFEYATVAQQATLIKSRLALAGATSEQPLRGSAQYFEPDPHSISSSVSPAAIPLRDRMAPLPLSPDQRRLWFTEQLNPGIPLYNESEAVTLVGDLDVDALEQALNAMIERHEILRTTIQATDGEPIAIVQRSWSTRIKMIDLKNLPTRQRDAEVERLLIDEPAQTYHLETEPGLRLTLICLGDREHVLILMMHHLICDWASEGVFWRELAALYRAFSRSDTADLHPLAIQYGDYASWQVKEHKQKDFSEELAFWKQNLAGAPQLLELPSDRPRPPALSYRGARKRIILSSTLTRALRALSQRLATTSFSLFASALNTLLYRYSGQEDILLGIPVADRDRKELQQLIGFLLHTQVLRTRLSGEMTFRELLAVVRKGALDLYLHRSVPFESVVRHLRPERNLSYSPLFQVMLIWRDREQLLSFIELDGLTVHSTLSESGTSKFDLTLFVTDCDDEIWLDVEYSTDLFDGDRIDRMLGHYQTVLDSVALNPDQCLAKLPLLSPEERHSMLVTWNQTKTAYPERRMLYELIEDQVERTPDAVAAVFEETRLTFRELDDRANSLAAELQGLGVGPNILVAIHVERSLEMLIGLVGILKAGGAYVPLDPSFPIDRLAFMMMDCQPRALVTLEKLRGTLPPHRAKIICLGSQAELPSERRRRPQLDQSRRDPRDLAYVLYTSGSTGKPKGVQISNRALVNFLWAMQREPGLCSDDTLVAVTTLSFDISGLEMFLPMITGARVVIASKEASADGALLSSLMVHSGATVMQATPATWRLLLEAGWTGTPRLKILCGGEAWSSTLAEELLRRCESLWNMYGPTETTIWSSVSRVEAGKSVLLGPPIANTTFNILDHHKELVPIGVPGELYIGGDGLAQGYLNRPDLTAERFVVDPFTCAPDGRLYLSGDLVRRVSDGRIEFLSRVDNQVKVRGFRIELGEIEACLRQHPDIRQCAVMAQEQKEGDRRLVAYIVGSRTSSALSTATLRSFLKQNLPEHMLPAAYVRLDSLPLTPNGKINLKALALSNRSNVELDSAEEPIAPSSLLELNLLTVWQRVLDISDISVRDNFFDIGGHSLQIIRLISEINRSLNASLTTQVFFLNPTIEALARVILEGDYVKPSPHLIMLRQNQSHGALFLISAPLDMCRLGALLNVGPSVFATEVPLSPVHYRAAVLNKTSSMPCMEELAAAHVALIRNQQVSGPCLLAGNSFSGLLAFEVAQQLVREGRSVEMLFILDSLLVLPPMSYRLKHLSGERARSALSRRLVRLWRWLKEIRARKYDFTARSSESRQDLVSDEAARPLDDVPFDIQKNIYNNIYDHYRLRPLETHGTLFLARDQHDLGSRLRQTLPNLTKIRRLFKQTVEIVEVPGEHLTMLKEPHIRTLANEIEKRVAKRPS